MACNSDQKEYDNSVGSYNPGGIARVYACQSYPTLPPTSPRWSLVSSANQSSMYGWQVHFCCARLSRQSQVLKDAECATYGASASVSRLEWKAIYGWCFI